MAKKKFDYYEAFERQIRIAAKEAKLLESVVEDYDSDKLMPTIEKAHEYEHEGDEVCHDVFNALAVEFLPPFDREDVIELVQSIDEVTDYTEGCIQRLYMHNVKRLRPEVAEFVVLLRKAVKALGAAIVEFRNFKKSKKLNKLIIDVSDVEEEADQLFFEAMHDLYSEGGDPIDVYVDDIIFQRLENAIDACEHIADLMGSIHMRNA